MIEIIFLLLISIKKSFMKNRLFLLPSLFVYLLFTSVFFSCEMELTPSLQKLDLGTDGTAGTSATYVCFGSFPQTLKTEEVTITSKIVKVNGNSFYLGSDDNYYAKVKASPYLYNYVFSNGESIISGKEYYFKVEPINWRVLTDSYIDADKLNKGNLVVAENILMPGCFYELTTTRDISDKTVYPNNYQYSDIRTLLNGKSFVQSFFSIEEQELINSVLLDNSDKSTPNLLEKYWAENTTDKAFLLSEDDVDETYFADDNVRQRIVSDYARATGACMDIENGCGMWWLRSPDNADTHVRIVNSDGSVIYSCLVSTSYIGIVPALTISSF